MSALAALAWAVLVGCFAGLAVALQVSRPCATSVGPYLAAGMFLAWVWLAWLDKGKRQR